MDPEIPEEFNVSRSNALHAYYRYKIEQANYMEIVQRIVPRNHIIAYINTLSSVIRTGLSQLPDRLAARIAKESDEETCYHLIMTEIHDISKQLEAALTEKSFDEHLKKTEANKDKMITRKGVSAKHK